MVWGIFLAHFGLLVPPEHRLNITVFLSTDPTGCLCSEGCFQQDNMLLVTYLLYCLNERKKIQSSFLLYNFTLKSLCVKEKVVLLLVVTSQKQQLTSSLTDQCFY